MSYPKRKKALIPPRGLCFIGAGDFVQTGDRFTERLVEFASLSPESRVLDIGCGIGRLARPLTGFLSPEGSYDGFDIVPVGIRWCERNIHSRYPNFNFRLVALTNELYRSKGGDSTRFNFPYPDHSFTHALAISLFTHLLPDELDRYLAESYRVLAPGGVLYATFFISPQLEAGDPQSGYAFPFAHGHYALMDEQVKHANVLFEQGWLEAQVKKHGFSIRHFVKGKWKHADGLDLQDALVLEK